MSETLVVGATGTVGAEAVRALLESGASVRALVRSAASERRLPADVRAVRGDLRDDASLARAVEGVRSALFVAPHEPDEEELADRFVRVCEAAGTRVVFVGVHVDGATRVSRAVKRWIFGRMLAHYRPKFRLSERVRRSRDAIILMPTNFFQNDEAFAEEILSGVYSQPFVRSLNRVDVRDIGDAAARVLLDPKLKAGAYPVIGPASLDGADAAAAWSVALGREVKFDPTSFGATIDRKFDGKKRADFLATYKLLRSIELKTDPRDVAKTTALLGRPPRSYETYVADAAKRFARDREFSSRSQPSPSAP